MEEGLFAPDRALFPADAYTYESFVWAVATVRSRTHAPLDGGAIALVPLADQVSHEGWGRGLMATRFCGALGVMRVSLRARLCAALLETRLASAVLGMEICSMHAC
jgi:[ribulose-bisphosphate carboxylase]-lysine N-methyltransferase